MNRRPRPQKEGSQGPWFKSGFYGLRGRFMIRYSRAFSKALFKSIRFL